VKSSLGWLYILCLLVPLWNISQACLPLVRPKDDFSDIALTPKQRQVLGLPATSKAPTPGSNVLTPPRYSRTPSLGSPTSFTSSPLSNRGSPASNGRASNGLGSYSPMGSPLLHKAVAGGINGGRRSSFGSPSNFGKSTSASLFGEGPGTPSPLPSKRASIGLTNKFLFDKGRRVSSSNFQQQLHQMRQTQEGL
jgi:nucleoporin POM34